MKAWSGILLVISLTFAGLTTSCSENKIDSSEHAASLVQLTAEDHTAHQEPLVMKQFRGCKAHQ